MISAVLKSAMKYAGVNAFLSGVRPCVVAMILATALTMALNTLFHITTLSGGFSPDGKSILLFVLLIAVGAGYRRLRHKSPSPIAMILLSAGLGMAMFGI